MPTDLVPQFGSLVFTIVAFVLALSVIVAIHEFGHYIIGRWSGIKADVFSIGFGPRLASRTDRHGTRWQIAAIPLGGYVKFRGDADPASMGGDDAAVAAMSPAERRATLEGAPLWARTATVAAGPVFNFITAILLFAGVALWVGTATDQVTIDSLADLPGGSGGVMAGDQILAVDGLPVASYADLAGAEARLPAAASRLYTISRDGQERQVQGPPITPLRASGVAPGSAAAAAGLREGDVITAAGGQPLTGFDDLRAHVEASEGAPITLTVWRPDPGLGAGQGQVFDTTLSARRTDLPSVGGGFETRWLIGISGDLFFTPATRPTTLTEAMGIGVARSYDIVAQSLSGLWNMMTGAISSCNLRGAVTIAESSGAAAQAGAANFVVFIAVLSVAVGFLNLLPIPVLDGGHLAFYAWEAVTGRPASEHAREMLMRIGLALILTLMIFGLVNDFRCR
ncbi:RIP metalloprotease RseP [Paracoccus sp. p3-h83]|uniref:RIP metalloprotease RseP n=1 Tax=Paracoccus sp. p3-h83 TaxID=3342805 RepID=UPI0035B997DF